MDTKSIATLKANNLMTFITFMVRNRTQVNMQRRDWKTKKFNNNKVSNK